MPLARDLPIALALVAVLTELFPKALLSEPLAVASRPNATPSFEEVALVPIEILVFPASAPCPKANARYAVAVALKPAAKLASPPASLSLPILTALVPLAVGLVADDGLALYKSADAEAPPANAAPLTVIAPVTSMPVAVVSNFFALLWYKLVAPSATKFAYS